MLLSMTGMVHAGDEHKIETGTTEATEAPEKPEGPAGESELYSETAPSQITITVQKLQYQSEEELKKFS